MISYELYHYGIKGMKWGVRRFQNEDGSLTSAGKKRYGVNDRNKNSNSNKKNNRIGLKIASGIAVTAAIGAGAYFVYKSKKTSAVLANKKIINLGKKASKLTSGSSNQKYLLDDMPPLSNKASKKKEIFENMESYFIKKQGSRDIIEQFTKARDNGLGADRYISSMRKMYSKRPKDKATGFILKDKKRSWSILDDANAVNPGVFIGKEEKLFGNIYGRVKTISLDKDVHNLNMTHRNLNCPFTSVAYEARRRGLDVQAKPLTMGLNKDNMLKFFKNAKWVEASNFATANNGVNYNSLKKILESYGPGARGIMQTEYKNGGAHFINWEVEKSGKVVFVDAQCGSVLRAPKKYFGLCVASEEINPLIQEMAKNSNAAIGSSGTAFMRTDNLKFNPYFVKKAVTGLDEVFSKQFKVSTESTVSKAIDKLEKTRSRAQYIDENAIKSGKLMSEMFGQLSLVELLEAA